MNLTTKLIKNPFNSFAFRAITLSLLNLFDLIGTYYHVVIAKHAQELNPLMAFLLEKDPIYFVLVKLAITPIFVFLAKIAKGRMLAFWIVMALYSFVFIEHLFFWWVTK